MNTLIIIFIILCVLHLSYECLILPTLRLRGKYKLFALRDRLRSYEIKNGGTLNKNLMRYMHGSINVSIQTVDFFDMVLLVKSDRLLNKDQELRLKVEKNSAMFEKFATDELREIRQEMLDILYNTFIFNGLMLSLYLLPISLGIHFGIFLKTRLLEAIDDFTDIPENDSLILVPVHSANCRT